MYNVVIIYCSLFLQFFNDFTVTWILEYSSGNGQLSDDTGSAHVMGMYLENAIVSDKSK